MQALTELAFAVAALAFVLALAWFAIRLLARYGVGTGGGPAGGGRRLRLVQSVAVGNRERLLLVRCDGREYLLLTTPYAATVVERLGEATLDGAHELDRAHAYPAEEGVPGGPRSATPDGPDTARRRDVANRKPPGKTL